MKKEYLGHSQIGINYSNTTPCFVYNIFIKVLHIILELLNVKRQPFNHDIYIQGRFSACAQQSNFIAHSLGGNIESSLDICLPYPFIENAMGNKVMIGDWLSRCCLFFSKISKWMCFIHIQQSCYHQFINYQNKLNSRNKGRRGTPTFESQVHEYIFCEKHYTFHGHIVCFSTIYLRNLRKKSINLLYTFNWDHSVENGTPMYSIISSYHEWPCCHVHLQ